MSTRLRRAATVGALLLLAACSSDGVKMYEGEEKTPDSVATVRLWSPNLGVTAIDGKPTPGGTRATHAYVDPGEHEFTLAYLGSGGRTEAKLRTATRAARTYVFGAKEMSVGRYSFFIEDKGRDYDPACLKPDGKGQNC
jgi:hypothetical protein